APAPDAVPAFEAGRAPDFRGVERSVAETLLAELGLSALVIEVATADTAAGRVFAQTPQAGAELAPGDDVTLIVSSGPGETDE
ncbi:MAG: PASTA domain-containing protein, partial [Chloroflexi bacterium]|nr:PASTA domain-containing protein [Chloroflexota bacterium]